MPKTLFKLCISFLFISIILIDSGKPLYGQQGKSFTFDAELAALFGNNSNVVVEEIDLTTTTTDTFFTTRAKANADYAFSKQHSASVSISYNDKQYSAADSFNLQTNFFSAGYKFKHEAYTINLDYRRASAKLGGNDFLVLTQVSPALSFFVNKQNFVRISYTRIDKELVNNPIRNAKSDEYGLGYYFFWKGLNDYFISSVKFRQEHTLEPIFNFSSYQVRFAYKKRYSAMGYNVRLTVDAKYRQRDYNETLNPAINEFRTDKRSAFGIVNEAEVLDDFFWNLELSYVTNNTNLANAAFSETVLTSGIKYQF